jgi:AsmA protein
MRRVLKITAWTAGALLLLVLVAIISLPFIIDPNDYRDEIGALVAKQTGRPLAIQGDLKLSVFPWLGVDVGAAQLGNAPGFGPEPFARFQHAKLAVKLLPLLFRREVELNTVEVEGLRLSLARDRDGRTNWDDLIQRQEAEKTAPPPREPRHAPAVPRLGGIILRDAQVTWNDKQAGRTAQVARLNLTTGALDLTSPVKLDLDTDFGLSAPAIAGHLAFKGVVHHDEAAQRYRTEGLTLRLDAHGSGLPGEAARLTATGDAAADLKAQTAEVKKLHLEGYGMELTLNATASKILGGPDGRGDLDLRVRDGEALAALVGKPLPANGLSGARLTSRFEFSLAQGRVALPDLRAAALGLQLEGAVRGEGLQQSPRFTGQLRVAQFVPRDLMAQLGMKPPATADATVLSKASLTTRFDAGLDHAAFDDLVVKLDQSTLTGRLAAPRFQPLALRYDLAVDRIDADRYLPPPSKQKREAPATAAATKPLQLPLRELRALDIDGTLRVADLKAANLRSTHAHATLRAQGGLFRVHPVGANLYNGSYAGNLGLDVRGDRPQLSMDEKLSDVQVGPLLQDFMGKPYVTGKAQLTAKLTANGTNVMQIRKSVTGRAAFTFQNGTVNGINLGQLLREAYAKYKGQPAPREETRKTDFAEMRGSITVNDGLAKNNDLTARSPLLRVKGAGSANLVNEKVDYRVDTTVVSAIPELTGLKGSTIPLRITGTFSEPQFGVNLGAVLQDRAQQELQRQLEGSKKKGQKDVQKQLEDKLKGLIK